MGLFPEPRYREESRSSKINIFYILIKMPNGWVLLIEGYVQLLRRITGTVGQKS